MSLEVDNADSLAQALQLLSSADPLIRPVAGATDVLLRWRAGRFPARRVVSVADLAELEGIRREADGFFVGAGTSVTELMHHAELKAACPALSEAARQFASPQIRNRATVGGNLANASPAADLTPPLLALGTELTVASHRATRTLPLEQFFLGFGKTALRPDELITGLRIPASGGPSFQRFFKFGNRRANVIAIVNAAVCLSLEPGRQRRIARARVAFGSVAPRPIRATTVEAALIGQTLDARLIEACARAVLDDISPIDDVRASKRFRQHLAVSAVRQALRELLDEEVAA
jgi:CO/xanthine dehydrogenase FAD-binding subunit